MRHLLNFSNTLGTITETYRLSSLPLTTQKNALLMEQRAEVLPNIKGLDGDGSTLHVQFIRTNKLLIVLTVRTRSVFIALKLPETNAFLTENLARRVKSN